MVGTLSDRRWGAGLLLLAVAACGPTSSEFQRADPSDADAPHDSAAQAVGEGPGVPTAAGVCGDGFVNLDEECDDGNREAGDGCSSACAFESGAIVWTSPAVAPIEDLWRTADGHLAAAHREGLVALYDRDGVPRWQQWIPSDSRTADYRDTTYSRIVGLPNGDLILLGTENEAEFSEKLRGRVLRVTPVVNALETGPSAGVAKWEHVLEDGVFSGLVADPQGHVFVAGRREPGGSFVRRYDADGVLVWEVSPECAPWNLAFDAEGALGGICTGADGMLRVLRQDPQSGMTMSTQAVPGPVLGMSPEQQAAGFVEPKIDFAEDGTTLIAAFADASNPGVTVMRLDRRGSAQWIATLDLINPGAVADVGAGRVYVGGYAPLGEGASPPAHNLYAVDDQGALVRATAIRDATHADAVTDVEVGDDGFIYVATGADAGRLVKLAP